MKDIRGRFGNPLSKNCNHVFEAGDWELRKCVKCGAVNKLYRMGKPKKKSLFQRIFR